MPDKQLHLFAFMRPVSLHTGAWRYPGAYADANFNIAHLRSFIQKLEAAKFDAFFMADHLAVLNMPIEALRRSQTVTSFEPFTLLASLSAVTDKIGLAATASTTYDEPYHVARRFASLDHLSGGRAAWNIVTTSNPDAAKNFGRDEHMDHSDRYKRAKEFYDVVTGLWDSFADDAFIRNQETGIFLDPEKIHTLNSTTWATSSRSRARRQLAGETAEAVFAAPGNMEAAKSVYADIKSRAVAAGRKREHINILPAAMVIIGDSVQEAKEKRLKLDSLVNYESAIASLSIALGTDASKFDPDAPLPADLGDNNASKTGRDNVVRVAQEEGLTVRQLAQRFGGYGGLAFVGTPESVADEWETWLKEEASDGFVVTFPFLPQGIDDVVQKLVPELQRRGIFRKEYEGNTLREHLGLPRPENRFFA
ncbi:hypothetical protein MKX08_002908 [Trichoderma sp. CBMAI-0020]|nr:hypothetical protein MKX08_002908 [Trichoderma sp. CBMAI-0020]